MKLRNFLLAAVLVASTAMVAMAQEKTFTPYASIRYFMGAYYQNKDFVGNSATAKKRYDVDYVNSLIPGTSRFGGRFAEGNLTGQIEFGLFNGHNGRVGVRQAWGAYQFDMGLKLLVGNTDAPWYKPIGSEAWDLYGGPGSTQGDRAPRLRASMMGVYIDLQRAPVNGSQDAYVGNWSSLYDGKDQIMPLTTIGYELKSDMADIGVGATAYKWFVRSGREGAAMPQGAPVNDASVYTGNHSLSAYMAFVNGTIKLGGPFIKFNIAYEKAPWLLGVNSAGAHFSPHRHGWSNKYVKPSDTVVEGALELGYNVPGEIGGSVSAGYLRNLNSDAKGADRKAFGVNVFIPVAKGFRVVPTAYYLDEGKTIPNALGVKTKLGADCLAGVKFQVDL